MLGVFFFIVSLLFREVGGLGRKVNSFLRRLVKFLGGRFLGSNRGKRECFRVLKFMVITVFVFDLGDL